MNPRPTLETLMETTPFSQWRTPAQIAAEFNYSAKHVIRLVKDPRNEIAAIAVDGRWFILQCSFASYIENQNK